MDFISDCEGNVGSVLQTFFIFDAVILPVLKLCHNLEFDCSHVADSTALACSSDTISSKF